MAEEQKVITASIGMDVVMDPALSEVCALSVCTYRARRRSTDKSTGDHHLCHDHQQAVRVHAVH